MEYSKVANGGVVLIQLKGKFTFSDHIQFKHVLDLFADAAVKQVEIELSAVEFVDSAALGMLLLARDEAKKSSKILILKGPVGQVAKMFEISRFHDIFDIK